MPRAKCHKENSALGAEGKDCIQLSGWVGATPPNLLVFQRGSGGGKLARFGIDLEAPGFVVFSPGGSAMVAYRDRLPLTGSGPGKLLVLINSENGSTDFLHLPGVLGWQEATLVCLSDTIGPAAPSMEREQMGWSLLGTCPYERLCCGMESMIIVPGGALVSMPAKSEAVLLRLPRPRRLFVFLIKLCRCLWVFRTSCWISSSDISLARPWRMVSPAPLSDFCLLSARSTCWSSKRLLASRTARRSWRWALCSFLLASRGLLGTSF